MTKYKLSKHVNDKSYYLNINLAKNSAYCKKRQRVRSVSFETVACAAALACALAALALILSLK